MRSSLGYALAYLLTVLIIFSLIRLSGVERALTYATLGSFLCGVVFGVLWRPRFLSMLLSGGFYALLFAIDVQKGWLWLSHPKSMESGWMVAVAAGFFVFPLFMAWLGWGIWSRVRTGVGA